MTVWTLEVWWRGGDGWEAVAEATTRAGMRGLQRVGKRLRGQESVRDVRLVEREEVA